LGLRSASGMKCSTNILHTQSGSSRSAPTSNLEGSRVRQIPLGPLKSGRPLAVETPAPVSATVHLEPAIHPARSPIPPTVDRSAAAVI